MNAQTEEKVAVDVKGSAQAAPAVPKKKLLRIVVEQEKFANLMEAQAKYKEYRTNYWQGLMVKATKEFIGSISKVEENS